MGEISAYKIPESILLVIYTPQLDVLLLERVNQRGLWQSVTGSKESWEESLPETALRELREETGIVVAPEYLDDWELSNVYDICPGWQHRYADGVTQNTEHVFGLCLPKIRPVTIAPCEHIAWCWLPYRIAADQCF